MTSPLTSLRERAEAAGGNAILDAMICADTADRIQGFSYPPEYVIRDVHRAPGEQIIWRGPNAGEERAEAGNFLEIMAHPNYITFQQQCRRERMRLVAIALLRALEARERGE